MACNTDNFTLFYAYMHNYREAVISFVMSVRLVKRIGAAPIGRIFVKFVLATFTTICRENQNWVKIDNIGHCYVKTLRTFYVILHRMGKNNQLVSRSFGMVTQLAKDAHYY